MERCNTIGILWFLLRDCTEIHLLGSSTWHYLLCRDKAHTIQFTLLALICSIATFQPRFREPFLRPVRAATFGCLAVSFMVPLIHGVYRNGWIIQKQQMGIIWVLVTLVLVNRLSPTNTCVLEKLGSRNKPLDHSPDYEIRQHAFRAQMVSGETYDLS